jgi:DNA processing protein
MGADLSPEYRALLEHIDYVPTPIDVLVERSGMKAATISSMVLMLELQGHISVDTIGYLKK